MWWVVAFVLFLVFIHELLDWVKTCIKLADDTKIQAHIQDQHDSTKLQRDLDSLSTWSTRWLMNNPEKCKVMHIGHSWDTEYTLTQDGTSHKLNIVSEEKDPGVIVTNSLSFHNQCVSAVRHVN